MSAWRLCEQFSFPLRFDSGMISSHRVSLMLLMISLGVRISHTRVVSLLQLFDK